MNATASATSPWKRLLSGVTGGLVVGIINVTLGVSFAALIFSGPLGMYLSSGIGLMLVSTAVFILLVGLSSSQRGIIAGPQDSPAAVLGLVAAGIARAMAGASSEALLATVLAAIAVTSLVTGLFFLVLGQLKSGNLVRFIPYPVVGGFLAGTGWLLLKGGLATLIDLPLTLEALPRFFQPANVALWLPGVVLGCWLLWASRHVRSGLVTPVTILATVVLFYVWLALTGQAVTDAGVRPLLLGPFPEGALYKPLTPEVLAQVDWWVILAQAGQVAVVVIVSTLSLLLNAGGIELALREDLDMNHELRVAGVANLAVGLLGGSPGYHYLGDSVLVHRMGARGRAASVVAALSCVAVLFLGATILSYIPKVLVGGLLVFTGLSFLSEWLYDAWFKLSREDYLQVLIILGVVGTVGFLQGVGVGIAIALFMFVFTYSRVDVVKHVLTGRTYHSTVDRPEAQCRIMQDSGERLYILQLQGFVFFGTAQALLDRIRQRLADANLSRPDYLILDFRRVTGFDASTVSVFLRIQQLCEAGPIELIFTQLSAEMERWVKRGGLRPGPGSLVHIFADLDHGVEWCEEQILAAERMENAGRSGLHEHLARAFSGPGQVEKFKSYLERLDVPAAFTLFRQGDPADAIYFLDAGSVTVQLELGESRVARLRTILSGTVVGEMGVYLGGERTGTVVTAEPSTLYRLSLRAIEQMEANEPQIASALHHWIAYLVSGRLAEQNAMLQSLLD